MHQIADTFVLFDSVPARLPMDGHSSVVYFDLETTDLSKNSCEIFQVNAFYFDYLSRNMLHL